MIANIPRYLESWSQEIKSRADRVRLLIGDAHWLTDGHYKECLVQEFLLRHLSPTISCTRGFVRPPDESIQCSPEIDLLLWDPARHVPFFNEGGVSIVPPSSCLAHIEIKTSFEKATLVKALLAQAETQHTINQYSGTADKIWRGCVFLGAPESRSLESAAETLSEALDDPKLRDTVKGPLKSLHLPKSIAVFDKFAFFIGDGGGPGKCRIKAFDLGALSMAVTFCDLFSHLRIEGGGRPTYAELDLVLQNIPPNSQMYLDVTLKE